MKYSSLLFIGMLASSAAFAADKPSNPKEQTSWDLYVDSKEAYAMKQEQTNKVLFVDVRDPIEIMFTGLPTWSTLIFLSNFLILPTGIKRNPLLKWL